MEEFRLYQTLKGRYLASIFDFVFPFSNVTLGKSSSTFYICRHLHFARPSTTDLSVEIRTFIQAQLLPVAVEILHVGDLHAVGRGGVHDPRWVEGYKKSERSTNVTAHAIPIQIRVWLTYTQSWIKCNILVSSKKFNSKLQCECLNPFI